jgi:hypothetical protein
MTERRRDTCSDVIAVLSWLRLTLAPGPAH